VTKAEYPEIEHSSGTLNMNAFAFEGEFKCASDFVVDAQLPELKA
jgi:hypothetical protein